MKLMPLVLVRHRVAIGAPLPFGIRSPDHRLLLARGQRITSEAQLESLLERGALVDGSELVDPADEVRRAPIEALPGLWNSCMDRVKRVLNEAVQTAFIESLDEVSSPVLALIDRDPDLAIFQVLRPDPKSAYQYGVRHSVHSATVGFLAARRLGGSADEVMRSFRAALTMNFAIVELQGRLAMQTTPLTPLQREQIREHPLRGTAMLEANGIADDDWLRAVGEHHELHDGSGYPRGSKEPSELAHLISRCDVFTAKLSARVTRQPMPADRAARELFASHQTSAATAAILKEVGVFPPGSFVRLASGEMGIVVKRGASARAPIVAALVNRRGEPMIDPIRRDTSHPQHAVAAVIDEKQLRVRVPPERLVVLAAG